MEVDLVLSLHTPSKGFDFDRNKQYWMVGRSGSCLDAEKLCTGERRRFDATAGNNDHEAAATELRLVSWNRQPNEEDDHPDERKPKRDCSTICNREENSRIVGWPPIKSCRKKYHHHHHYHHHRHYHHGGWIVVRNNNNFYRTATIEGGGSSSSTKPMYVKVKMEGVTIARKIDVKLFNSFESLTRFLITMFAHYEGCDGVDTNYSLTYQGKEGDWLEAGDVPWKTFVDTVCRIKMSRTHPSVHRKYMQDI